MNFFKKNYEFLWNEICNKKGGVTPFTIIIASTFLTIFLVMFSSLQQLCYSNTIKDYTKVASDDLLSSFDEVLLSDYGLLAYNNKDALKRVRSAITLNHKANENAYFIKGPSIELALLDLSYQENETLVNKGALAETCIKIAEIHIPFVALEELNQIYNWSDSIKGKVQSYEKVNRIAEGLSQLDLTLDEIKDTTERINDISEFDSRWFEETEPEKIYLKLLVLKKRHGDLLDTIKTYEYKLDEYRRQIESIDSDLGTVDKEAMIESIEESLDNYSDAVTGNEWTISEVKERLSNNKHIIDEMLDTGNYESFSDLETDFYIYEASASGTKGKKVKKFLKSLVKSFSSEGFDASNAYGTWNTATTYPSNAIKLEADEKILLNEYYLSVLKSEVESPVRDFSILTRDERASTFPNGEIEYLIVGNRSSSFQIKIRLFGLRMGPNTLHIITDKEKFNLVKKAGSIVGKAYPGAGIIMSAVVITAWSGIESAYDVSELIKGNGVALMKTDESWHYDIDLELLETVEKESKINENKEIINEEQFLSYYNDYMRLMLLMISDDVKIQRFQWILDRNMDCNNDKKLSNYTMSHEIEWQKLSIQGNYYEE